MRFILVLVVCMVALSGCGLVRSVSSSEVEETRVERTEAVRYLDEFEGFSANIPVGMVEAVELPSGLRVVFRDGVGGTEDRGRATPKSRDAADTPLNIPAGDSVPSQEGNGVRDSVRNLDSGWIALDYRRGIVERDSVVSDVEVERSERLDRETEVSTGSGFIWLFVGIAVALALVVAGFLFFRR